jgi:predicted DCC family thiol-disulfide oxidoreductase YuxK
MNTQKKLLLYDAECPFCVAYTSAFIKAGILQADERRPFSALNADVFLSRVDEQRQGNEIPLVDVSGGATVYGVDALLLLLGRRWPRLPKVFAKGMLRRIVDSLYAIISYNRRILLPRQYSTLKHSCAPAFSIKQRLRLIFVCIVVAVLVTAAFGGAVAGASGMPATAAKVAALIACGTGWVMQMSIAVIVLRRNALDYLAHLAVLQLIGVMVLLPALAVLPFFPAAGLVTAAVCVALSSTVMLRGHIKRISVLGYSPLWTLSWALLLTASATITTLVFLQKLNWL